MTRRGLLLVVAGVCMGIGASPAATHGKPESAPSSEGVMQTREVVDEAVYTELENSPDGCAYVLVVLRPVGQLDPARLADHQAAVRQRQDAVLARLAPGEFTPVYRYDNFAVMTGYVNVDGLARLAMNPDVVCIGPDAPVRAALDESVPFINADQVREQYCYTGQGITVAVLDTGIDTDHPDLINNVASGGWHFLSQGADYGPGAEDDNGHGTNVAGIVTSAGVVAPPGVAPDVDVLAVKVLDANNEGWVSDWVAGINYVISVRADYNRLGVINMSLGTFDLFADCPCDHETAYNEAAQAALQAAKNAGIVTFASSGNGGWCDRMTSPACLSAATAVAAVYDQHYGRQPESGTYRDIYGDSFGDCFDEPALPEMITCFSNRSPCNQLAAPGRLITAPGMGGGTSTYTGTSQAAPHCSGVAALLLQSDPARQLTPDDIVQLLEQTGQPTFDPCETTPNPVRVDALAAVEVLVNTWTEATKFLAPDGAANDWLGRSVAISGDTAVIGAAFDDDNGENSGSAYVLRYDGSSWVQEAKLLASDGAPWDRFGESVAVSGDTVVIGAVLDSDTVAISGSAYVFRYDGSSWVEEAKLLASDGAPYDSFGYSAAISGDSAVIGALEDDDNGDESGSAYVFRFDGSGWVQEAKLLASDGALGDRLGCSVAISGDAAVIGAFLDDDNGYNSGSAYVFRFDGSGWVQEAKLLASDGGAEDYFGLSVVVSNDAALIGAPWNNDFGTHSGSAYVFRFDGASWIEEQKLLASDGATGNEFGWSVSVSGYSAVVGAPSHDDNGPLSGSAYAFVHNGSSWLEQAELLASDGAAGDHFGESVSISAGNALIGAIYDDDNGSNSGSAYVFSNPAIEDCNGNGIPDACDLADGTSQDVNGNGIPDECECWGDLDGDDDIDLSDLAMLLANYGTTGGATYEDGDLDNDGDVDLSDLAALLAVYGTSCP